MSEIDERKKKLDKIRGFDYNEFTQIHRNPLEWLVNQNIPKENFLLRTTQDFYAKLAEID